MLTLYLSMITDDDDKKRFETLYTAYHGEMLRYAGYLLRNPNDAEDIVHDAFVSVAGNIEKFSAPACHNAYGLLVILVRNLSRNKHKRDRLIPFVPLEERGKRIRTGNKGLTMS